jgi:predicted CXXCH cytochrome family protein
MTFVIRQITKRPTGQDIVRDKTVEGDTLTVGRGTDNDLFLSDLRVGLHHLVMQVSGSRLQVETRLDKTFLVGGKATKQLTLQSGRTQTIEVGPYALGLSFGDGAWIVRVERVEPAEVLDEDDVDEIFTLRGTALGKRLPAWAAFAAAAAVFLALPIAWFYGAVPETAEALIDPDHVWLSGELSGVHANLEGECEACHVAAFEHVTDATCLECHEGLGDHAEPGRLARSMAHPGGFDGFLQQTAAVFGKEEGECADCHREHNGEEGIILSNQSLCTDCHMGIGDRLPDARVASAGDFGTDHPVFQAMVVAEPGPEPVLARFALDSPDLVDNSGLKFPHDLHLATDGGVARQAAALGAEHGFGEALVCADCHTLENGGRLFEPVTMEGDCQMCHSLVFATDGGVERRLPHGEPDEVIALMREYYRAQALDQATGPIFSNRRRPGDTSELRRVDRAQDNLVEAERNTSQMVAQIFSPGGACFDCHEVIEPDAGALNYDIVPVTLIDQFMVNAVFDHEKHEVGELDCQSCHEAEGSDLAAHVLLPGLETRPGRHTDDEVIGCRDCHGGEDARGDRVASACIDCHGYHDGRHAPLMTARLDGDAPGRLAFRPGRWGRIPVAGDVR